MDTGDLFYETETGSLPLTQLPVPGTGLPTKKVSVNGCELNNNNEKPTTTEWQGEWTQNVGKWIDIEWVNKQIQELLAIFDKN